MSSPGNPIDLWADKLLRKAAEDEAVLHVKEIPDGPFGFHAQQAVEKLLKALLAQLAIPFERTHDLRRLAAQLSDTGEALPSTPIPLSELNMFAVVYRYDSIPELEIPDRPGAIESVRILRKHITGRIQALSTPPASS